MNRTGEKWNNEETILAFYLYCQTPFGKISKSNDSIIELAKLIGRTPSSVALKMHNLAHFDPALIKRNVVAMSHGSKLDEFISSKFFDDWESLSYEAESILHQYLQVEKKLADQVEENTIFPQGYYVEYKTKNRVHQDFFRNAVLSSYDNKCCITGISIPELIIASHIKPWKVSDEKTERTNPTNGLALNAFHDMAFDKGLLTIDLNYTIHISPLVRKTKNCVAHNEFLFRYEKEKIMLPNKFIPDKVFLEYHNDVIFKR